MKSSEALRAIRPIIEARRSRYICWALHDLRVPIPGKKGIYPKTNVEKRLGKLFGGSPVQYWLITNHPPYLKYENKMLREGSYGTLNDQLRLYRLRWIDWMIEGYEKVGD